MAETLPEISERFPGFIGTAPMKPRRRRESRRAIEDLGASACRYSPTIAGKTVDLPRIEALPSNTWRSLARPLAASGPAPRTSRTISKRNVRITRSGGTFGWLLGYETSADGAPWCSRASSIRSRALKRSSPTNGRWQWCHFFEGRAVPAGTRWASARTEPVISRAVRTALKRVRISSTSGSSTADSHPPPRVAPRHRACHRILRRGSRECSHPDAPFDHRRVARCTFARR